MKVLLAIVLSLATSTCFADEPGSAKTAQALVPELLGRLYTVADTPTIKGDVASVHATILDLTCHIELQRRLDALPAGWIATKIDCKKKKS